MPATVRYFIFIKYYLLIIRKPAYEILSAFSQYAKDLKLNESVSIAQSHMASKWQTQSPNNTTPDDQLIHFSHADVTCPKIRCRRFESEWHGKDWRLPSNIRYCLPTSLYFLKAEMILAEHMATQQTDYFPAHRSCDCLLDIDGQAEMPSETSWRLCIFSVSFPLSAT